MTGQSAAGPDHPAEPVPPAEPAAPSDLALLRAHVAGDPDAFRDLFHRHRDRLWAVAVRTLSDREEAADALQDALLSAHRAAGRFRGDSAVTTWLHRIVINACLDRVRRRKAQPTVPLPEHRGTDEQGAAGKRAEPAAPAVDHDTVLVVREALHQLPVEQRAAIVLVDLQGYPVAEAARLLAVAEGTVKSRCARGRARLAVLLGHLRTGPGQPVPDQGNQPTDLNVPSAAPHEAADGRGDEPARGQPAREQRTQNTVGHPSPEGGVR